MIAKIFTLFTQLNLLLIALSPEQEVILKKGYPVIVELDVSKEDGGVKAQVFVNTTPERAWEILKDCSRFPEFMPNLKRVEILEEKPKSNVVRFTGEKVFTFQYTIERFYEEEKWTIRWVNRGDNFDRIDGYWQIEEMGSGVLLTYYTFIKPRFYIPQVVIDYLQKHSIPDLMTSVKKKMEGKVLKEKNKKKDIEILK